MSGPLWTSDSDNPSERLREADKEWRRLKRLSPEERKEQRVRAAEHNLERVKRETSLNIEQARDKLDSELRHGARADAAYLEGTKLYFDIFKIQMTITIGSVGGTAAIASLFRPNLHYPYLLIISLLALFVSLVVSLESARRISSGVYAVLGERDPDRIRQFADSDSPKMRKWDKLSTRSLIAGLFFFALFAALNLIYPAGDFVEHMKTPLSSL